MRPGGTNLLDSRGLCRCSQAPYPYDAYLPENAASIADPQLIFPINDSEETR